MNVLFKSMISILLFTSLLNATEYRAFGIGGDETSSRVEIEIKGEAYTLLPFSYLEIESTQSSKSGEYTVFIGKVNGKDISPIKVSADYKNDYIVIKVFKSVDVFNDTTLVSQSNDIYADKSYKHYSINIQ